MNKSYRGLEDRSGDKTHFTIIPNYIINHSTANDQALYLQMKRYAGEGHGTLCLASEKLLCDRLGIGVKGLKKSLAYLVEHRWIEYAGYRLVDTPGGQQKVKTYLINDIWKMNADFYSKQRGVPKKTPSQQGVLESIERGVQKESKGYAFEKQRIYKDSKIGNILEKSRKNLEAKGIIPPKR